MKPMTRWAAPALLAALLSFSACSGSSDSDSSGGAMSGDREQADANAMVDQSATEAAGPEGADSTESTEESASVINTGSVTLSTPDVEKARFDAQKVVDQHKGKIADEETHTDSDGEMQSSRLVIRVPSADFDTVMTELGEVAQVAESTRSSEDVTTQVIDNKVRIRAQEKSLQRIEALLARATSISEIVAIESKLTSRQAELDSLKQQQAWLADQTSMSTVTLYIEHDEEPSSVTEDDEHPAFVAGLIDGWDALKSIGSGLAVVAGALLPFAVVFVLLGLPLFVLLRRLARRFAGRFNSPSPAETP